VQAGQRHPGASAGVRAAQAVPPRQALPCRPLPTPHGPAACRRPQRARAQGYSNPDTFDPDRFSPERAEDVKFASNFLVFGHGPHYCVGKEVREGGAASDNPIRHAPRRMHFPLARALENDKRVALPLCLRSPLARLAPCTPVSPPPQYATNHLAVFLAVLSTSLDFGRLRSAVSDDVIYLPTLYPGDSVFSLSLRKK
jgi:hypothetical protein